MHLAKTVLRVRKDLFQCRQEPGLFITERCRDGHAEVGNRLQEFGKGAVILACQPSTAQGPTVMQFAHDPQLGSPPSGIKPSSPRIRPVVCATVARSARCWRFRDRRARVNTGSDRESVPGIPLICNRRGQAGPHIRRSACVLLALPAELGNDIIAIGAAFGGEVLPGRSGPSRVFRALQVDTVLGR